MEHRSRKVLRGAAAVVAAALVTLALSSTLAGAASATVAPDAASIDHVEPGKESVQLLFSVPPGAEVDLDSVTVGVDGYSTEATAIPAEDSDGKLRRTTVLAIDTSMSMRGERFAAAKDAARAFLSTVPADVQVGIVSFAGDVVVVQEPTVDRVATEATLDDLELSLATRLYDGVRSAVQASRGVGARSVLVLSDGRDTSSTELSAVTDLIEESDVKVDVVAFQQQEDQLAPLTSLAVAGNGSVLSADDPEALAETFAAEAEALGRQVLVTFPVPDEVAGNDANLEVSFTGDGATYADAAYAPVRKVVAEAEGAGIVLRPPPAGGLTITGPMTMGAIGAFGVCLAVLVFVGFAGTPAEEETNKYTLEERINAFGPGATASTWAKPGHHASQAPSNVKDQAKEMAERALAANRGLEAKIAARLEGAGMSLKSAEWLLLHLGIAVGAGLLGALLSGGGVLLTFLLFGFGLVGPWVYLSLKKARRIKKFNAGLADTLQLMAGSLQAGLSLAQSVDTIVKEGNEPIAGEFRRVLVETRLGVGLEDSMEDIAVRMESKDFKWVVMAIRIQREVGGNLAELLLTVAETLREREYLRRHVAALAAEGKLSAWLLGGLPPVFLAYLAVAQPSYVNVLFTDPRGWIILAGATVMLLIGFFWMSKLVKVEV